MKNITQKEIAKALKCEPATISRYFSNKRDISLKDANKVHKVFDLPITIFIDPKLQIKHFGKSFITSNSSKKIGNTKRVQEDDNRNTKGR